MIESCAPQASQAAQPANSTVECYSGHAYAGEPRAVTWQGRRYPVQRVEARWRTPAGPAFRIRTLSGERFELDYHEAKDRWSVTRLEKVAPHPSPVGGNVDPHQPYKDKEILD